MRRCQAPGCPVEFVPARSDQRFCCPACRKRAGRARKGASGPPGSPNTRDIAPGGPQPSPGRSVPPFEISEGLDAESRRVVEYVNAQTARWNAGLREEPLKLIRLAAEERLRRFG